MAGHRSRSRGNQVILWILALVLFCLALPWPAQARSLAAAPAVAVAGQTLPEEVRASGVTSLPPVQVTTDTADDAHPSLLQAADGQLWVVWYSTRTGNRDIWYKSSSDGGATWSPESQLTTDTGFDAFPTIVQAADGKMWVVWTSDRSGNRDLWYKTSDNDGATWSTDAQLTTDPGYDLLSDMIQTADHKLWIVWCSGRSGNSDIWYKTSSDGGATWSPDGQLTTNAAGDMSPAITQGADGKLWVAWDRSGSSDLWYKTSSDGGATWWAEDRWTLGSGGNSYATLVQAQDGALWLMWERYNYPVPAALWYKTSSDNGATWSTESQWTRSLCYDEQPDLAALHDGSVAVAWQSSRTGNYDIWFGVFGQREDADPRPTQLSPADSSSVAEGNVLFTWTSVPCATGYEIQIDRLATFDSPDLLSATEGKRQHTATLTLGTWYWRVRALPDGLWTSAWQVLVAGPLVQVTTATESDLNPSITQASDGKLWAVWWSWRGSDPDLWYSTSSDNGATWASGAPLNASPGFNTDSAIAQAADGRLWVVWTSGGRTGNADLWYKTSSNGGTSWSPDTQFTTDAGQDYDPAITRTADGRIWVVWASERSGNVDLWYKTSSDNGTTWSAEKQLTSDPEADVDPAVAEAGDGRLWVVWSSPRSGNYDLWCKTSSDGGTTWSDESQLTTEEDDDFYPSFDRATDGTLWLVWVRYIDFRFPHPRSQLWYKTSSDNGASWSTERQWARFTGADEFPDLAALQDSSVALAWESDRTVNADIWFGIFGQREDVNPPPHVATASHLPGPNPDGNDTVTIRALVTDETALASVHAVWSRDGTPQADVPMYDDGAHNDNGAGDGWYGGQMGPFPVGTQVSYQVRATDNDGNSVTFVQYGNSFTVLEPFTKTASTLFVADQGPYSDTDWFRGYYTQALDDGAWAYDLWDVRWRGVPDATVLNLYTDGAVVWASPSWSGCLCNWYEDCNPPSTANTLRSYLDHGGHLFLSGQNIGESLRWESFFRDYLHAEFISGNSGLYQVNGASGDPIGDGLTLGISGGDGANNQSSPDEINPLPPAVAVFSYDPGALAPLRELDAVTPSASAAPDAQTDDGNGQYPFTGPPSRVVGGIRFGYGHPLTVSPCPVCPPDQQAQRDSTTQATGASGTATLRVDTGTYKVVYFAFGFEGINTRAGRAQVLDRVLRWLGVPPPARLEFSPSAQTVRACSGPFTMGLELKEAPALGGFELVVSYDPQVVHVLGSSLGSLLHSTTRVFTPLPAQIDNNAGTAALGAFSFGNEPAPSGSGPIATITFTVVNTGTAAMDLEQVQLTEPSARIIHTATEEGSITVLPALFGDMDCDCDVDVVDIMLVASRWRARVGDPNYDPRYNLDGDGDIDIVDIMLVASHWSETCGDETGASSVSRRPTAARPDAARARAADVQISARTAQHKPGDVFTLDIEANSAHDLGGFECTLTFDPQALQVEKVELGNLLGSTGRSVTALGPEINNDKGAVHLGAFSFGPEAGPDGRGILARLTVRALQAGGSSLAIAHLQLTDRLGRPALTTALRDQ